MKRLGPILLSCGILTALPVTGAWLKGKNLSTYLEFPPRTQYIEHAPFSRPVFTAAAALLLAVLLPILIKTVRTRSRSTPFLPNRTDGRIIRAGMSSGESRAVSVRRFPWWGWMSFGFGFLFWILSWTRFQWMNPFQPYTFTPQWLCYIATVNALTYRRTGRCLMTHQTGFFLKLFPLSTGFWWFFEYLNRFVQNWYYLSCDHFTALQYFMAASLSFSTVLPAVLSTEEWLAAAPRISAGFERLRPLRFSRPKRTAWMTLFLSMAGLFVISWYPNWLFPLLWTAPLLLILSLREITGDPPFFKEVSAGDWRRVYRFCISGLICGLFWELWNFHSLARWAYTVPLVDRFPLFEMPILGYSGYLPFGLECAVVADWLKKRQ
jgi:hypothetical protein